MVKQRKKTDANRAGKKKSEAREWIISIVVAVSVAVIIKLFLFDFVMVQGSSMYPTLKQSERLVINKLEYEIGEPAYGDIVVLRYSRGIDYVKRVIAKGGDTIEIKNMKVYRNGRLLKESYINKESYGDFAKVTVPAGKYFVMGDNRANSSDSRYADLGFVDEDDMIGHVVFRFWPWGKIGSIQDGH
ncbi:signal peptidase I [Pseudoramibacter alactolyticus]|jgi:signal peptidase I|uniref:signal peptidase I n=1 Tax=Pseudoramibacter alactolyticus TaxID=113287 RepID=UPI0023565FE2|nr:signal peptidase I [Pseudoramibacter alactolyticus]MBM6968312.1 signal peptidase I [Pseudoramibacter alactolyticus]